MLNATADHGGVAITMGGVSYLVRGVAGPLVAATE